MVFVWNMVIDHIPIGIWSMTRVYICQSIHMPLCLQSAIYNIRLLYIHMPLCLQSGAKMVFVWNMVIDTQLCALEAARAEGLYGGGRGGQERAGGGGEAGEGGRRGGRGEREGVGGGGERENKKEGVLHFFVFL
jgi:hypothetical protein